MSFVTEYGKHAFCHKSPTFGDKGCLSPKVLLEEAFTSNLIRYQNGNNLWWHRISMTTW